MNDHSVEIDTRLHRQVLGHPRSVRKYQYTPLSKTTFEIRLLQLLPASISSDVRVSIDVIPFDGVTLPDYEALSYTWGSMEDQQEISIGIEASHTLTVTRNLADALPYLRFQDKPRTLWIDAVSINQQDLKERSHQVQSMADIYSRARRVVVWLGKESYDSSLAVDCVRTLSSKIEIDHGTMKVLPRTNESHWLDWKSMLPFDVEQTKAITNFCNRDWFRRLWIWQEVRCARDIEVLCGEDSLSWQDVQVLGYFCLHKPWEQSFYDKMSRITRFLLFNICGLVESNSFFALADQTKHCLCSDPRDRIYALKSMATERDIQVEPDYEKPVSEVYRSFVVDYLRCHNSLKVLTQVGSRKGIGDGLPSWVPDFSSARNAILFTMTHASGNSGSYCSFPDKGTLIVPGVVIGQIISCEPCRLHNTSNVKPEEVRRELIRMIHEMRIRGNVEWNQNQLHNLYQALFSGAFAENYFPPLSNEEAVTTSRIEELLHKLLMLESSSDETLVPLSVPETLVIEAVAAFLLDRSIALSSDGTITLTPEHTQARDVIVVVLGSDSPMVLRPLDTGRYMVVGEAFYDGAMYGESILGPFPEGSRPVWQYDDESRKYLISFLDCHTGKLQLDDPRLEGVPRPPAHETGEDTGSCDPRLNIEFFKSRGINMESLTLV